jgi:hypothetical protein
VVIETAEPGARVLYSYPVDFEKIERCTEVGEPTPCTIYLERSFYRFRSLRLKNGEWETTGETYQINCCKQTKKVVIHEFQDENKPILVEEPLIEP